MNEPSFSAAEQLERARKVGRRRAWRVTGILFGIGALFCTPSFGLIASYSISEELKRAGGRWFVIPFVLFPVGLFICLNSITPSNVRGLRCFATVYQLVMVFLVPAVTIVLVVTQMDTQCRHRGSLTCAAAILAPIGMFGKCIGTAVSLHKFVLRPSAAAPSQFSAAGCQLIRRQVAAFDAAHGRGTRFALLLFSGIALLPSFWLAGVDGYYEYPTRKALSNLWRVFRIANFALASGIFIVAALLAADGEASREDAVFDPVMIAASGACLLVAVLVSTPANRRRVHAIIGRLGTTLEERRAAAVSALVSNKTRLSTNVSTPDLNALTVESFLVLPFECLREEDFSSSADSGLNRHATPVALGDCDAFLSHSWHDDGSQKWAALRSWADDFERATGRPPKVWLDKGCIDQQNIDASLAALPLYLAGCDRLVVVAGPTYASRLWCVIEIFTFLFMGGSRERIDVLPIGDDTMEQVQERL